MAKVKQKKTKVFCDPAVCDGDCENCGEDEEDYEID